MTIQEKILRDKLIAVVVFNSADEVKPVIEALLEGGISMIELALRSEYAMEAIKKVIAEYPEMTVGVGTVITTSQVEQLVTLNAPFAVAPGLNKNVIEKSIELGIPFFPGITTPSEIEAALEYDIRLIKFFPAEPSGGLAYLNSINAPYAHLGIKYIPLGGINAQNLGEYLKSPIIGGIGGSWIAPRKLIEEQNWQAIKDYAAEAVAIKESI